MPIPAQDPPVPMAGGHADRCSLHPPPWFSLGIVLRMRLPRPEPGAVLLAHVPVPGSNPGNGQAIGDLLLARAGWMEPRTRARGTAQAGALSVPGEPCRWLVSQRAVPGHSTAGLGAAVEGSHQQRAEPLGQGRTNPLHQHPNHCHSSWPSRASELMPTWGVLGS